MSQRYERGSTLVTSNLPFEDWTSVLGSERLTGALLDRLTHHVSILSMNSDSYRLKNSTGRRARASSWVEQTQATPDRYDPKTGEIMRTSDEPTTTMKGPDRDPSSYMLPAAAGPVLLRPLHTCGLGTVHARRGVNRRAVSRAAVFKLPSGPHCRSFTRRSESRSGRG
jgi:hypothetical protein